MLKSKVCVRARACVCDCCYHRTQWKEWDTSLTWISSLTPTQNSSHPSSHPVLVYPLHPELQAGKQKVSSLETRNRTTNTTKIKKMLIDVYHRGRKRANALGRLGALQKNLLLFWTQGVWPVSASTGLTSTATSVHLVREGCNMPTALRRSARCRRRIVSQNLNKDNNVL